MPTPPILECEDQRLAVLQSLKLLDTPPEAGFQDLVAIAKDLAGTPIALVTLVDSHRQWFKACIGLDISESARDVAFCAYAILRPEVLWIEDAAADARFAANPLVTGPPHIRFYAGAPLIVDGHAVGSLCVLAPEPRAYDAGLAEQLGRLARLVAQRLVERRDLALYAGVVSRSPDGIACCDGRGVITYWNPAAERIFDCPAAMAMGRAWKTIVPAALQPRFEAAFERLKTDPDHGTGFVVLPLRRADGSEFRIELGLVRTGDTGSAEAAVIMRDCTERERARAELEAARDAAEASSRAKTTFLANMGHELRTPMNGVMGMLQLLGRQALAPESRDFVLTAEASAGRLHRLLERILTYARLEAGEAAPGAETFEVEELLAEAVAAAGDLWGRIRVEVAPAPPGALCADAGKLRQVLGLLVENALRFSSGEVGITAAVHSAPVGLQLVLTVADMGPGVAVDQRERIFDSFHQADASDTRLYDGTGMGLPLARALARALNGELVLDTEHHPGARFVLTAPVSMAPETAAAPTTAEATGDPAPLRILVAEDHPVNEKVLLALLELFGQTADVARNGAQAVAAAQGAVYDLILMDIQMPVMDGIAATAAIQAGLGDCCPPIFAVTASASPEDLQTYLRAGMAGLVPKPVQPDLLLACLEAVAARRQAEPVEASGG